MSLFHPIKLQIFFIVTINLIFFMSFRQHFNRLFGPLHICCFKSNDSIRFWDKLELDIKELHRCEWTGTSLGMPMSSAFRWCSSAALPKISKTFVPILYYEAFKKLIDGIADRSQQPDFLFHKKIQAVLVKLCNPNNYDELIRFFSAMDETD